MLKAGRRPVTARQETRDGEAGTIRDAASPGIFINDLSFASAKQPYLEAERPIGKSLSRGKGFRDRVAWIKIMT